MKITKEIHELWKAEKIIARVMPRLNQLDLRMIGKWHYHYKNKNGEIGLIRIKAPWCKSKWAWEACGVLDFTRYPTRKAAEVEIYHALREPIPA